jgi:hypothetical protein
LSQLQQALSSGNLSAAQSAYTQLQQAVQQQSSGHSHHHHHGGGGSSSSDPTVGTADAVGKLSVTA